MKCYLPIRRKPSKACRSAVTHMSALLIVALGLCTSILSASAQKQRHTAAKTDVRIIKSKPSVFISYDHEGNREPLKTAESNHGVWLRLHNNTKTALFFASFSVQRALGEVGMFYDLVAVSQPDNYRDPSLATPKTMAEELPVGYTRGHTSSAYLLGPGRSVLFSVPREHLPKGVALRVSFNYEWELEGDMEFVRRGEPEHYVLFYSSSLPK